MRRSSSERGPDHRCPLSLVHALTFASHFRLPLAVLTSLRFRIVSVLINLLPDFLAVLDAPDREAAYRQYREAHRPILDAYWRNYVLDPDSPHADEIVAAALRADRSDLYALAGVHRPRAARRGGDRAGRRAAAASTGRPTST